MKKTLLLASAMMLGAQGIMALSPLVYDNAQFLGISPDASLAASYLYESAAFINPKTGDILATYMPDENGIISYNGTNGNIVSNTGIILGSTTSLGNAAFWKQGKEWTELSVPDPSKGNGACGISADGLYICGYVGLTGISIEDHPTPMIVPAVWTLQSDGTYGEPEILPYPEKDFTNRVPQYVTAVCISDDGKTVAGQVQDYSGCLTTPIVFKKGDDGKWAYTMPAEDLLNPDKLVLPDYPGESPAQPQPTDFMSDAEAEAYNAAVDAWDWSSGDPYPEATDYMTDEEIAAYNAAVAAWQTAYDEWSAKYMAWDTVFGEILAKATAFEFNVIDLTPDGKTMLQCIHKEFKDPDAWMPIVKYGAATFDLENGTRKLYNIEDNVSAGHLTNDGTILGFVTDQTTMAETAILYLPGQDTPTPLHEYIQTVNPELYEWMSNNMRHDIETYDMETGDPITMEDVWITGRPLATRDGLMYLTTVVNTFNYNIETLTFGYVLPISDNVSVKNVAVEEDAPVHYYNLQGVEVENPQKGQIVIRTQGEKAEKIVF